MAAKQKERLWDHAVGLGFKFVLGTLSAAEQAQIDTWKKKNTDFGDRWTFGDILRDVAQCHIISIGEDRLTDIQIGRVHGILYPNAVFGLRQQIVFKRWCRNQLKLADELGLRIDEAKAARIARTANRQ